MWAEKERVYSLWDGEGGGVESVGGCVAEKQSLAILKWYEFLFLGLWLEGSL